jgi:protein-tyrosine phosphatase
METYKKNSKLREIRVLFVCTGNIFRSMSAEYLMKQYIKDNKIHGINVSSAGIVANPEAINPFVFKALKNEGINPTTHIQRRLDKRLLEESDIIISMAVYHEEFILKNFNKETFLYNELANGKSDSVLDIDDVMPDWKNNLEKASKYFFEVIHYIQKTMPQLVREIQKRHKI